MMAHAFKIKLMCGAIRTVTRGDGLKVDVKIEGVSCWGDDEPMYDVREILSGVGYPALEHDLKPREKLAN